MIRDRATAVLAGVALTGCVLCLPARGARADETTPGPIPAKPIAERVKGHASLIKERKKAKDVEALLGAIKTAVELFEEAGQPVKDPDERKALEKCRVQLVKMVGRLTSSKKSEEKVTCSALGALGTMRHQAGARYVVGFLRCPSKGRLDKRLMIAIESAEKIACSTLRPRLLKLVEDSKNIDVAKRAMLALGGFKAATRCREKILVDLTDIMRKWKPGNPTKSKESRVNPGEYISGRVTGAAARWRHLAPALPKALNALTGKQIMSAEDWIEIVRENKRNLGALFED